MKIAPAEISTYTLLKEPAFLYCFYVSGRGLHGIKLLKFNGLQCTLLQIIYVLSLHSHEVRLRTSLLPSPNPKMIGATCIGQPFISLIRISTCFNYFLISVQHGCNIRKFVTKYTCSRQRPATSHSPTCRSNLIMQRQKCCRSF